MYTENNKPNIDVYSSFKNEICIYASDKENYYQINLTNFLKNVFFPNIEDFAYNLPTYYENAIQEGLLDIFDIHRFCGLLINDTYITILKDCYKNIEKLPVSTPEEISKKTEEIKIFEAYCMYGLMLFNSKFFFNHNIYATSDQFFTSKEEDDNKEKSKFSSILNNFEKKIVNLLLNRSITKAYKKEQKDILISLNVITSFIKKIHQYYLSSKVDSLFTPSFCNDIVCECLNIDNNFKISIKP